MKQVLDYINNYRDWYTIIFLLVIFSNLGIGGILLTDIIYGFFAIWTVIKYKSKQTSQRSLVVVFILLTVVNFLLYNNTKGLLSTLRFDLGLIICSLFYAYFNNDKYNAKLVNGYCYACVFFSLFVLVQFFSYYVLKVNIDFSFGDYAREENVAGTYDALEDLYYRTGGMFKEPSWYAAYVSPVLFMLTILKRYKELFICLAGLLASTSGLGFVIMGIYLFWLAFSYNKKIGIIVGLIFFLAYTYLPFIFNRVSGDSLVESTSFAIRIVEPFNILKEIDFSIIGLDPSYHYDSSGGLMYFLNTFMFIYFYFGIIGLLLFLRFSFTKNIPILFFVLVLIILIEGLYGRIDFWMMLLACLLFNSTFTRTSLLT